ncbi:MAG: hypothetical protein GY820_38430 [Gammaproteobacteria bacterium]|nr:hypothetical protein [Gammaproteobacteria bacterium]
MNDEKTDDKTKDKENALSQEDFDSLTDKNTSLQATIDSMQADNTAMQGKMNELLGETKKAKAAARKQAEDDGNFEQLYNSSEQARTELQEKYEAQGAKFAKGKCETVAKSIAMDLADGDNALLLSSFIAPRLKFEGEEVKILDSKGQLTVSTVEDLKAEFKNNSRYVALLKGNQSSGGGASGGKSGGAADKVLTRADFDNLDPIKKMDFSKSGGKIID